MERMSHAIWAGDDNKRGTDATTIKVVLPISDSTFGHGHSEEHGAFAVRAEPLLVRSLASTGGKR